MKKKLFLYLITLLTTTNIFSQGLFESVLTDQENSAEKNYEINGYIRSDIYSNNDLDDFRTCYSEATLKLKANKGKSGKAYAELRLRDDEKTTRFFLREAYVDFYTGSFDFRVGRQIIAWGRADGYNPTDNINPKDITVFSPDEDDIRMSNFIIKSSLNFHNLRIESALIPHYRPSEIPMLFIPEDVNIYHSPDADKLSGALRCDYTGSAFGASLSYYSGYSVNPGIEITNMSLSIPAQYDICLSPYQYQVIGADFSTSLFNKIGLRSEFAYKLPKDYESFYYIPNPEAEFVFGFDKEIFTDFNLILQYAGKQVFDWNKLEQNDVSFLIKSQNRMIFRQTEGLSHSVLFRAGWDLLYQTLHLEWVGTYNFQTEESFNRLKTSYDIADAFTIIAGGNFYKGNEGTLFGMLEDYLTTAFMELKVSF